MKSLTTRVKAAVLVTPAAVPVTVIVEVESEAEALAVTVIVVEQFGEQETGAKEVETPAGKPEAVNVMTCAGPEDSAAVIIMVAESSISSDTLLAPLEILKSKTLSPSVTEKLII